jgi:uncharacterized protein (TIGR02284 family)
MTTCNGKEDAMATTIGKETNLVDMLNHLIELDFDAVSAYQAAIDRLDDQQGKTKLREFMQDHERHTQELSSIVNHMGGSPPTKGDFKAVLTKGKVVIGQIAGDLGILKAMHSNEEDTNTAYERASERKDLPENIRVVLQRNLSDERRHKAWIEQTLERFKERKQDERKQDKGQPSTYQRPVSHH